MPEHEVSTHNQKEWSDIRAIAYEVSVKNSTASLFLFYVHITDCSDNQWPEENLKPGEVFKSK